MLAYIPSTAFFEQIKAFSTESLIPILNSALKQRVCRPSDYGQIGDESMNTAPRGFNRT